MSLEASRVRLSIPGRKQGKGSKVRLRGRCERAMIDVRYKRYDDDGSVLPRRVYIYRDIRFAVDGKADKRETIPHLHYRHRKWEHGKSTFFAPSLALLISV